MMSLITDSDFNLKLLQWRLLKLIREQGMEPRQCSLLVWILEDCETMEYLLTSGDILDNRSVFSAFSHLRKGGHYCGVLLNKTSLKYKALSFTYMLPLLTFI